MNSEKLIIKSLEKEEYIKYYLTLDLNQVHTISEIRKEYNDVYQYLIDQNIHVIYEKGFGLLEAKEILFKIRNEVSSAYKTELAPFSYIEGSPAYGSMISSITIHGIYKKSDHIDIEYIRSSGSFNIGTRVTTNEKELIYLMNLNNVQRESNTTEFAATFEWLESFMKHNQLLGPHLVRTWIYLKDINDHNNYEKLNTARRAFFEKWDIDYSEKSNVLPASTCIGGIATNDTSISMDVMFLKNKTNRSLIDRVYTSLLNEAEGEEYLFRPTFSRALKIEDDEHIEIQLSGTASVNAAGKTVYKNDAYQQIKKALENVSSMLEKHKLSFDDFYQSTCFFKSREYVNIFEAILNELGMKCFTKTFVVNDVCRDDLLFEIDGVIMKKTS
ncbi:chorismate transformation enzyme, FkbO/Hyg5 family [Paenibacillus medicaginis]|uniref:Chorismatase FkbO/Hyg5-like N-terminal domain-containing protein n=1 Tax=Paenibacillus medicaginis TaxID=1470560 RepID=A0ABV5C826_9BACL